MVAPSPNETGAGETAEEVNYQDKDTPRQRVSYDHKNSFGRKAVLRFLSSPEQRMGGSCKPPNNRAKDRVKS